MKRKWYIVLIIMSLFYQCNENQEENMTNYTYLALGDSYTIGESVLPTERYPYLVFDSLKSAGFSVWEPVIIAKTGWTTDELNSAIEAAQINDSVFSMVSLLIGVNNQYCGRDTAEYRREFSGLLSKAIAFSGQKSQNVIVVSIPDWGVTPFAEGRDTALIARQIDAYNAINLEISLQMGVHYINVTDISRLAKSQPDLIAADGLHPSAKMYKMWADLMFDKAEKILKNE